MIGSLTLPAIAFVAAISGLPGLKGLPMPASKKPRKKATTKPIRVSEVDKIMSLLTAAMMDGDLDAFDTAHEALVSLADHGQKIDKAVFDDLAQMREQMLDLDADHAMIDIHRLW